MSTTDKQTSTVEQTVSQFIDAGIGLAMLPFSLAQKSFSATKEETANQLSALQARGEQLETQIRQQLNPSRFCSEVFQSLSPKASREAKIEELSNKVDILVELVATLAAKQAAEKASEQPATETPKPTARKRTTRTTTAKSTAKPRTPRSSVTKAAAKTSTKTAKKDA